MNTIYPGYALTNVDGGIGLVVIVSKRTAAMILKKSAHGKWGPGAYLPTCANISDGLVIVGVSATIGRCLAIKSGRLKMVQQTGNIIRWDKLWIN